MRKRVLPGNCPQKCFKPIIIPKIAGQKRLLTKGEMLVDNLEKVMQVFEKANQPLNSKAVQEATGLDKKEVDKLIKKLKDAGKLESPKRCFYQPKA